MSDIKFIPGRHDGSPWADVDDAEAFPKLVKDAPAMLALLRELFAEYHSVYDGVSVSAPMPVEMLERVRALIDRHK